MKIFCSFCFDTELNKYMSSGSHYLVWRELLSIYRMTKPHIYGTLKLYHRPRWGREWVGAGPWTLAGIFVKIMVRLIAEKCGPVFSAGGSDRKYNLNISTSAVGTYNSWQNTSRVFLTFFEYKL